MADNSNTTPVEVTSAAAPEETPVTSAKGKGKAVATEAQDDVNMDEDDDEDEDDEDDEVSFWQFLHFFAPRAASMPEFH